ncbi:MAG TPA: helix-turn-helix domain-containing protein [Bacteroidia bacterium]|nr:helix-turn-helix domain-containing protein [Bacteroidia bacterium]
MIKKTALLLFISFSVLQAFSQKASQENDFNIEESEKALLQALNKIRKDNNLDTMYFNEKLGKASEVQALDMAKRGKADLTNSSKKYATTAKRVMAFGGTNKAEELVLGTSIVKGKTVMNPKDFADAVFYKWRTGKRNQAIIKNVNYIFASPAVRLDESGKKAYVSIVFGNFNTFNTGANKKKELAVPFTNSKKKMKAPEERTCNACKKFKDWDGLAKGLYEENGKVYLKYDNLKMLGKFIRKSKDGFAVDIVQRAQYEKPGYTIVDNNLQTKGVLLKPVFMSKIYSKNRIKPVKKGNRVIKATKLDIELGKIPTKITGEYEMNLLIVQDGKLCKTIIPSNIEQGEMEAKVLTMLLMPDSAAYLNPPFEPKSESTLLNFTVPFEKNKFDYKPEDMVPFLNALQEPDFLIDGLYITAYSSIEGDANANAKLQKKRAESIVKALKNIQKEGVVANVKTSDSWSLFQLEMEGSKFDYLTKMSKEKAIQEINSKGLAKELEPFLAKERFAQIVMDVTYDIAGPKEERFCVSKFNQAIKKGDIKQAYKIQYFIGQQQKLKRYSYDLSEQMNIPFDPKFSGGDDKPLNFKEACAYLGFAPSYLYKLTYRKIIPHYKPSGKMLFFSKADLDEWIFKNRDQKSENRNHNEDEEDEEDPASPNGYAVTRAADHSKWDYE